MKALAYGIDLQRSKQANALTLRLYSALRTGHAWSLGKELSKKEARAWANEIDEEVLPLLDAHGRFDVRDTEELLQWLQRSGRLFADGRMVVVNLVQAWAVHCHLEMDGEQVLIEASLRQGEREASFADCTLALTGRYPLAVVGSSLRLLGEGGELIEPLSEGVLHLHPAEVGKLLGSYLEDPETELCLSCDDRLRQRLLQGIKPLPLFQLTGPAGAFGLLKMRYDDALVAFSDPTKAVQLDGRRVPRLLSEERAWEADLLETGFRKHQSALADYHCPLDQVAKSLGFLIELGWQVLDVKGRQVCTRTAIETRLTEEESVIQVRSRVHFGDYEVDAGALVGAFNRRSAFVDLGGGAVGLLDATSEALAQDLSEGEVIGDAVCLGRERLLSLDALWKEGTVEADAAVEELRIAARQFDGVSRVEPGASFTAQLRPYQQEGLNWLACLRRCGFSGLLADDMGLGKTVQVLALISTMPRDASVLLVMPTSLLFNWRQEIKRFLPDRALTMHHGSERRQDAAGLGQGIVLTSYALLRQDEALLTSLDWDLLVLDEAQAIKNPSTQTAKAAFRLRASMRLSLTGTPIENRLEELWSQFHFLLPGLLGDFASFAKQALAADVDARYLGQIRRQIRPFLLRRLKEDVALDLPEKIEQVVLLELPQEQRDVYDRFVAQAKSGVLEKVSADGWNKHRMEVLELLLRLRQICCHPLLVGEEVESAKARLVLSDVATIVAEGKKVLVYSQFAQMLGLLRKDLATTAAAVFHIDGQTRDRAQQVNGFQEHEGPAVFLLSLKAAGVGLNLSAADYVLLYDPWWNDAAEAQAIDRAHRIGRQGTVLAKRYIVRETVEEKMLQLKQRKQGLAASILEDREGSVATALNADDLAFLLA